MAYKTGTIREPLEKLRKNLRYIGSLSALRMWYASFRTYVMSENAYTRMALEGAADLLSAAQAERIKQLKKWAAMVPITTGPFAEERPWIDELELAVQAQPSHPDLESMARDVGVHTPYPNAVAALSEENRYAAVPILQSEIDRFVSLAGLTPEETVP